MRSDFDPAGYDAWYRTPRGRWIGDVEFELLMQLLRPVPGDMLLDVGCGSGYFSRRFAGAGLAVTGLDPDERMLSFARAQGDTITCLRGDALALPFADGSFDHCAAVTSLCFVADPIQALREMLRVARRSVVLGLLNRHSILYRQKHEEGGYRGARWNSITDVRRWIAEINLALQTEIRTALFFPDGNPLARFAEQCLSNRLPWGGFLAAAIHHR